MTWSSLPLFPTDDGWPYPDVSEALDMADLDELDLDALELRADPHAFDSLSYGERAVVTRRFGLDGSAPLPLKQLAPALGLTRGETREMLGSAIYKLRVRLTAS